MRLLSLLYYHGVRRKLPGMRRTKERFRTSKQFDRLYTLDKDPFNVLGSSYEQEKRENLISFLEGAHFDSILDIGCGTGVMLHYLAAYGGNVVGLDFSSQAIELAKRSLHDIPTIRLIEGDLRSLKMGEQFDLFVCSEVLYYLTSAELEAALRLIGEHARPNAKLISVMRSDDVEVRGILTSTFSLLKERAYVAARPYTIALYAI